MGTILITLAHLASAAITVAANNMPAKPSQGDTEIEIDGTPHSLDGVKHITVIDEMVAEYIEDQLTNPWWTFQFQWVDGMDGLFTVSNLSPIDDIVEGEDYELPIGWVQLMDDQGNLVWVNEEAVSSCTPNGPYWR